MPSEGGTVDFAVTLDATLPSGADFLTNTTQIVDDGMNGPESNTINNSGTDTDVLDAAPDLAISKSDAGITTNAGGSIVYTIDFENVGDQDATGVVITETLPANTSFDSVASDSGWTETAPGSGVFVYTVGDLAATESGSATFAVTVVNTLPGGLTQIDNSVTVADDGADGTDSDLSLIHI